VPRQQPSAGGLAFLDPPCVLEENGVVYEVFGNVLIYRLKFCKQRPDEPFEFKQFLMKLYFEYKFSWRFEDS